MDGPLIKDIQMFFFIFVTLMLEICESNMPEAPKLISSPSSNMSRGLERNLSRWRRSLQFPTRSLVFPEGSKVVTEFVISIPVMGSFGLSNIKIAVPLTFDLPSMSNMSSARSSTLESEHRGIFQTVEEFLAG